MKLIIGFCRATAGDWQEVVLVYTRMDFQHTVGDSLGDSNDSKKKKEKKKSRQESKPRFSRAAAPSFSSTYLFHLFDLARFAAGAHGISG